MDITSSTTPTYVPSTPPTPLPSSVPSTVPSTPPTPEIIVQPPEAFMFVHQGHCASGWMGDNSEVDTVDECANICREREGCGYFAFDPSKSYNTNCATYFESDGCLDDDLHPQYTAYQLMPSEPEIEIPLSFVHEGHCASGWMGNNRSVQTVYECT